MKNDVVTAGIGSVSFAVLAAGGLVFAAGTAIATAGLTFLLIVALFGFIWTLQSSRRERAELAELEGLNRTGDGARDQEITAEEVIAARRLREDESAVLGLIAEDQEMETVLKRITEMLSTQYSNSRFRIVSDSVFDDQVVDGVWQVKPRTSTAMGWELQAVIGSGDTLEPAVMTMAADLARLTVDKEHSQSTLRYQADHDALTGLLSRRAVLEVIENALATGDSVGVIYCDVDEFKEINDTLGHQAGDDLLIGIAGRLKEAMEAMPFACHSGRIGGDEYLLAAVGATSGQLKTLVERLSFDIQAPFSLGRSAISTSLSIGVSFRLPENGNREQINPNEILREADIALYQVKRSGRNGFRFFDTELREREAERKLLEEDLRQSITNRSGLFAEYQPQFDVQMQLVGFEALGRWDRSGVGRVSPAEFIPVAVERNMMAEFDLELFQTVAEMLGHLRRQGQPLGKVAINVSAERLEDPQFVQTTLSVLRRRAIDPSTIVLEITESSLLKDLRERGRRLEELRAWGIRIAIDDFGTGYSSLSYLRDLPVDIVKLDREFVSDIDQSPMSQAIVQAILTLSKVLELEVVAEGIERKSQIEVLAGLGCDVFQGFLLGKPLPIELAHDIARRQWPPDPFQSGYDWPEVPPNARGLEQFGQLPEFKTL